MYLRIISLLTVLKLTTATTHYGYTFNPRFFTRENSATVQAKKLFEIQNPGAHYVAVKTYPAYHIIPYKLTTTTTSTPLTNTATPNTTTSNTYTQDEFPIDLLNIAQQKLGIRRLDEIPSISELGELLGTSTAGDTIKYMRHLTSTDQGIALIKAYIESSDYTDSTVRANNKSHFGEITHRNSKATDKAEEKLEDVTSKSGFLARLYSYLNINDSPPKSKAIGNSEKTKSTPQKLSHVTARQPQKEELSAPATQPNPAQKPLFLRNPLPYHYPIPLRPLPVPTARTSQHAPSAPSAVHLNTPKTGLPAQLQLSKLANIPPKQLERFLQLRPKLAELAAKVRGFPLTHHQASAMQAQLLAAVKQAIAQDADLRKLLSSVTDTLK